VAAPSAVVCRATSWAAAVRLAPSSVADSRALSSASRSCTALSRTCRSRSLRSSARICAFFSASPARVASTVCWSAAVLCRFRLLMREASGLGSGLPGGLCDRVRGQITAGLLGVRDLRTGRREQLLGVQTGLFQALVPAGLGGP